MPRLAAVGMTHDEVLHLLIADGSHDELLERSELYREIVEKGMPDQVFLTRKPAEVASL